MRGKDVYLRAIFTVTTAITANANLNVTPDVQIGTVSADFRPTEGIVVPWDNGARFGTVYIENDGVVTVRTASTSIPATEEIIFSARFLKN